MHVTQVDAWLLLRCFPEGEPSLRPTPKGAAGKVLTDSLVETNEIFGIEMFATAAAVVASGEQLSGRRVILSVGHGPAAGALIKAPSRIQVIFSFIEKFRGRVAQLSASS